MKPPDESPTTPPVPSLVEDYKAHEAQLHEQLRDLERRRHEVRDAAERTASDIITTARQDIRRIVTRARQDLLALKSQLDAVGCPPDDSFDPVTLLSQIPLEADERPAQLEATASAVDQRVPEQDPVRAIDLEPDFQPEPAASSPAAPSHILPSPTHEIWNAERRTASSVPRRGVWADPSVREDAAASPGSRLRGPVIALSVGAVLGILGLLLRVAWGGSTSSPTTTTSVEPEPPAATAASAPAPTVASNLPPAEQLQEGTSLLLQASRDVWLRAFVDGQSEAGRLYSAGEQRRIAARREVVLRVGDAGALSVSVDGAAAAPLGRDGQLLTRRFTAPAAPVAGELAAAGEDTAATPSRPLQASSVDVLPGVMAAAAPAVTRESAPETADPQTRAAEQEILARDRQWFDAYYRNDRAAMAALATPAFAFTDARAPGHVVAMGTTARRSLDKIRIDFAGIGAVLTAQMVEHTPSLAGEKQIVSTLSGIWTKGEDGWRMMGLRLTTP